MKQVTQTLKYHKNVHIRLQDINNHFLVTFISNAYILKMFSLFFLVDTAKTPFIDQTTSKDANEEIIATFWLCNLLMKFSKHLFSMIQLIFSEIKSTFCYILHFLSRYMLNMYNCLNSFFIHYRRILNPTHLWNVLLKICITFMTLN